MLWLLIGMILGVVLCLGAWAVAQWLGKLLIK